MTFQWMPESARFYAAAGNHDKAMLVLKRIATENKKLMPPGRLVVDDMQVRILGYDHQETVCDTQVILVISDLQNVPRGRIRDLMIPELKKTTILLGIIWHVPTTDIIP